MHYLIDGHNLIAKMPDISLSDPDDEVKLVLRLRSWAAQRKKRQVTVIFDGGMPGGKDVRLSTHSVRVIFAQEGRTADALLIARVWKVKHAGEFTLVSSDNQIVAAAEKRRMPVIKSDRFARRLGPSDDGARDGDTAVATDNPQISNAEVEEWLDLFGPVPERKPTPKLNPKKKKTPAKQTAKQRKKEFDKKDWRRAKRDDAKLSEEDVSDWLDLFGGDSS